MKEKRDFILIGSELAFAGALLFTASQVAGKSPTKEPIIPEDAFKPMIMPLETAPPTPTLVFESPIISSDSSDTSNKGPRQETQALSPTDLKLETYRSQLDDLLMQMEKRPDVFGPRLIKDITMYYPMYKAVADKYNIDWKLLWITHEYESGASNSKKAFNGSTYPYFGGMQRNVNTWSQSYVNGAFNGLEFLNELPMRNKTDAMEIAAAGKTLAVNYHHYEASGNQRAIFNSFKLYVGSSSMAQVRLDRLMLFADALS